MPFYDFVCNSCRLVLGYYSKRATAEIPACPHCGGALERAVQAFSTGRRGADLDSGDGLGGGFADPERAAAAVEGLDARLAAARRRGGETAAAEEIASTAAAAGIALDPDWKDAAAKEAAGDASAYESLVDAAVPPVARDAAPSGVGAPGKPATGDAPPPGFARDPELRELAPPPLPPRRPSPWD